MVFGAPAQQDRYHAYSGHATLRTPFLRYIDTSYSFVSIICARQPLFGIMFKNIKYATELMGHEDVDMQT